MNLQKLKPFLLKSASSKNASIKKVANDVLDRIMAEQADEQVPVPELQDLGPDAANKVKDKDEVDELIHPVFKDLTMPDPNASTFGKIASAYVSDLQIKSLPKDTQKDILKFFPNCSSNIEVVNYGMTVNELLPKVDPYNFHQAEENIKKELNEKGKKVMGDKLQEKINSKYILLLNDSIIDGHHYLALAKALNITCSLKVLDLTVIRFQLKTKLINKIWAK